MRRLAPAALLLVLFVPCASAWTWPVQGPVIQTYSFDQAHPYTAGQQRGIAIGADAGAPVRAPATGNVSFAGTVAANGKTVTIQTAAGLAVSLTHLGSLEVSRGDAVAEGAVIGTAGSSGEPEFAVPYVHLGIRDVTNPQGYLDPLSFLPATLVPVGEPAPTPAPVAEPTAAPVAAPPAAAPVVAEPAPAVAAPAATPTTHAAPAEAPAGPVVQSAPSAEAPAAQATAAQGGKTPAASAAAPAEPEGSAPFEVAARTALASARSPVIASHTFSVPAVALRSPATGPLAAGLGAARQARKAAPSETPASPHTAPSPQVSPLRPPRGRLSARARAGDQPLRQPLLVAPLVVGGLVSVGAALAAGLAFLLLRRSRRPLAPVVPLHSVPRPSECRRLAA